METKAAKCRKCRMSGLFSRHHQCYDCQRIINNNNGEAKIPCRGCRAEFSVPSNTTIYRCSVCQTINTRSSSGNWLSNNNKDRGNAMRLVKSGIRDLKLDTKPENAKKTASLMNSQSQRSSSSFSSIRCNKRAVLVGVTYRKRKFRLKGTVNDVINMKELLTKIFDFPKDSIRVLTEDQQFPEMVPTKKNILESLNWLVEGCQAGDSLVFYFSGHGVQQPDSNDDEMDGMDECICPVDFIQEGIILDNDINNTLVRPLKEGVTLHAIVDACHSGTILDLTHVYDPENKKWNDNAPPSKGPVKKNTSGGTAICISACGDSQMAADTTAFRGKGMNGVMTFLFTKIIRQHPEITYEGLIQKMDEEIQMIIQNSCHPSFLRHMFRPKIAQELIISSSEKFDVSKKIVTL